MNQPATFVVEDPATLEHLAYLPDQSPVDATTALEYAAAAMPSWSATALRTRGEVLRRAWHLMLDERQQISDLISAENGKSQQDAQAEVTYAAEFCRWYAEEAVRPDGSYGEAPMGGVNSMVRHVPVGVAALVTPWNFPAAMATRKVAPAIAAGCAAVLKPAAETPLTALYLADLLTRAGLPDGLLQVVTTTDAAGVVGSWLGDDRVRKISFTGSTAIGRILLRQAADRIVNSSMELGGNAPFVVTDDADLDAAVAGAMTAKFRNGGQACTAANRFYVHAAVHDDFVRRFGAAVERLIVGPAAKGGEVGPLISKAARHRVETVVAEAVSAGARIVHQAGAPEGPGHFVKPMVLTGVEPCAAMLHDELFAPIAPIVAWEDEQELLKWVNHSELGLAAYVFAGDLQRALRIGESIEAGMVGINRGLVSDPSAPFGGVKQSGIGREGARDGIRAFQETQYLAVDWP